MKKQTNGAPASDVQREVLPKQSDGPWSVKEVPGADGHLSVVDAKGLFVARIHRRGEVVTAEARANARIIAAGPDLLEALTGLVDRFSGRTDADDVAILAALAAVAKAEGR